MEVLGKGLECCLVVLGKDLDCSLVVPGKGLENRADWTDHNNCSLLKEMNKELKAKSCVLVIQAQGMIVLRDYAYFERVILDWSVVDYLESRNRLMQCFVTAYASFLRGMLEMPYCCMVYFDQNQIQNVCSLVDLSFACTTLPFFASSSIDATLLHVLSFAVLLNSFPQLTGHKACNF